MTKKMISPIKVIGISVRTTNDQHQAAEDIGQLWAQFMSKDILHHIPNRVSDAIFSIYCRYDSDHTGSYTTILGCEVSSFDEVPEGMESIEIEGGPYHLFTASGNLNDGVVYQEWVKIWGLNMDRKYSTDFEVYGEKAQDPTNAEVDIFIAVS